MKKRSDIDYVSIDECCFFTGGKIKKINKNKILQYEFEDGSIYDIYENQYLRYFNIYVILYLGTLYSDKIHGKHAEINQF